MHTILIFDDNAADCALIQRTVAGSEYRLHEARNLDAFCRQMRLHSIDLAIIALASVRDKDVETVLEALRHTTDTKVMALARERGDGLTTLLRAESLHAHHLLAKPIDPHQLLTMLSLTFPLPIPQDELR